MPLPFTDTEDTYNDVVENEILSYTAAAGEFLRGWNAVGFAVFRSRLKIDGTTKHDAGSEVSVNGVAVNAGYPFTPIPLSAGEVVTVTIQRAATEALRAFKATIY